jgi:hypothetical protein
LKEFENKKLVCVSKESLELGETGEEKKTREAEAAQFDDLCKAIRDTHGDKVEKVVVSNRISNSPCILVTGQYGWSSNIVSNCVSHSTLLTVVHPPPPIGVYHEGAGPPRLFHVLLHGPQEDPRVEPNERNRQGDQKEGR